MSEDETPKTTLSSSQEEWISRKGFIKKGLGFVLSHVVENLPALPYSDSASKSYMRPPGALAETVFQATCQPFCTECLNVCPRDAIFHDDFGFPVIHPETSPCVMCFDVACTKACPTGALTPLDDPHQIALGTAVIELTVCTAYQGSGCKTCYEKCPIPNEAIQLVEGLPQVVPEQCTGCGACVYECPTPGALSIRPYLVS